MPRFIKRLKATCCCYALPFHLFTAHSSASLGRQCDRPTRASSPALPLIYGRQRTRQYLQASAEITDHRLRLHRSQFARRPDVQVRINATVSLTYPEGYAN